MVGEDQFKGVQVYDVIQDNAQNYWFTTNNGLYFYNGVKFEQIQAPYSKNISFFNLVVNSEGTVYCKNLNNQIFQLKDKKATLFHTLNKEESSSDFQLIINGEDQLMIFSKSIKIIDKKGKVQKQYHLQGHYCGQPTLMKDKSVIAHLNESDSLIHYQNNHFDVRKINFKEKPKTIPVILGFYYVGQNLYAVDLIHKSTYLYQNQQLQAVDLKLKTQINKTESVRIYGTNQGLWITGTLPGISLESNIHNNFAPTIYGDYFISDVYEDKVGNILLSTFDKGIIVIPDILIDNVTKVNDEAIVTKISCNTISGIFLGTSNGEIYQKEKNAFHLINKTGTRSINVMEKLPNEDWLIVDNGKIRAVNTHSGKAIDIFDASLKGIAFIDDKHFFLGTNKGVFHVNKNQSQFTVTTIPELSSRVYLIQYDKENQMLYVANSEGLFSYQKGELQELKIEGKSLFVNGMAIDGQKLYISTKDIGITLIQNGKIISSQPYFYNQHKLNFKKIKVNQSNLIAETSDGFYQIELKGNKIIALHYIYGFYNNRIIDFDVLDNQLWVSHSGGIQNINLNYKLKVIKKPLLRIESIQVNNKEMTEKDLLNLSHNQNKIRFYFSSNNIRSKGIFQYQYRLLGSDTTWQVNDFNQNTVDFNSLSAGKYTFQIRLENQGAFSQIKEIKFNILPAFYFRWWFISGAFIAFLILTYLVIRWQLKRQRKKLQRINELNSSKLTAIKSQMNPHFIFNSLNSIQDLILKGDVEHSYSYISAFSNMVRATLSNSEKEFIAIEQEIQLLELYLSLEKLRFKNDFEYEMIYDKNMDILIPPMLIQPFIENALVHGLLHKKGTKKISIRFQLNEVFECIVEDNGIGRKAAHAIQSRQQRHESFSSKAIKKRFEILSHVYNGIFGFEYEDLETDGQNAGTRVTLKMPFIEKF